MENRTCQRRGMSMSLLSELIAETERLRFATAATVATRDAGKSQGVAKVARVAASLSSEGRPSASSHLRHAHSRLLETTAALCRSCGAVLVDFAVIAKAPVVEGWPMLLGCEWCKVLDRNLVPRPSRR